MIRGLLLVFLGAALGGLLTFGIMYILTREEKK